MSSIKQFINGNEMRNMIISAANNLINKKVMVDDLNVFPVPDGDTGTNMSLTAGAVKKALLNNDDASVSAVADESATASLRGARGNSGVILSQFFRGMSKGLKGLEEADVPALINAMKCAKETAYRAVMKPQEGTVLTVAREMHEAAETYNFEENADIISFLQFVVEEGNKSLDNTPNLLPQLKQAGVVDAGGKGLMVLIEGALYYLENNEIIEVLTETLSNDSSVSVENSVNPEDIKFGYCTEFIIQKNEKKAPWKKLRSKLEYIGDCVIVIDDVDIIKVHVHSNNPGIVLEEALKLGSLVDIKIDNLREQAEEKIAETEKVEVPFVKDAFVSVASGDGIVAIMQELGVNSIIHGGQTMNPSTDDFIAEIEKINAENIYVFPNNKNIILAAEQAKDLTDKNVYVIPTKTIVQGISCLIAFDESAGGEENVEAFIGVIDEVKSGSVTFAARDCNIEGLEIHKNDIMGLVEGKIKTVDTDVTKVCVDIVSKMIDVMSTSISLYKGAEVSDADADDLKSCLEEMYPNCDVNVYNGGQPLYYYYIAVE